MAHRFYTIFITEITFWTAPKALKREFSNNSLDTSSSPQNPEVPKRVPPPNPFKDKSSCRWHTHTHTHRSFLHQAGLSWRCHGERLDICILYPPQTKKVCPKFLARVFSLTKALVSSGFSCRPRVSASHDDMCGFECALLARRVKASPQIPDFGGLGEEVQ